MKKIIPALAILFFTLPSVGFASALTQQQSISLIAVVQSSPGTPASAFVSLITAFSNITTVQASSLITVVQAAPGVSANAFVNLLTSFTDDTSTQPTTPVANQAVTPATTPAGITQPATPPITTNVSSPTLEFNQTSQSVSLGVQGFKISWASTNVESCLASGAWSGSRSTNGEEILSFSQTGAYTYTMTCIGKNGQKITGSIVITAIDTTPKTTFSFNGNGSIGNAYTAKVGDTVRLGWSTQNSYGGKCTASGDWSGEKIEGNSENLTFSQVGTFNYTLVCMNGRSGEMGTNTATVTAAQ